VHAAARLALAFSDLQADLVRGALALAVADAACTAPRAAAHDRAEALGNG
jgi:hypothetical protein